MFNSNLFNIGILILPLAHRTEKMIAWVKVVLTLVKDLMLEFTTYRTGQLFFIAHNSQVMNLEHILNNKFNPDGNLNDGNYEGNGIYIEDGQEANEVYIYNTSEAQPDTFIYNTSEAGANTYLHNNSQFGQWVGFAVNVPDTFTINENEMRALVNRLKLAGKIYAIKYYTI